MKVGNSKVGEVYAWALFELAQENKLIDAVNEDLASIKAVAESQPEFMAFVGSPYFTTDAKSRFIRGLFAGRVTDLTLDFLMIVAKRNRLAYVDEMAAEFERFWDAHNGYTTVHVTLANAPDEAEVAKLTGEISAAMESKIRLQSSVDEDIIGGIIIRHGDELIDNSARSMLERAVRQIMSRRKKMERSDEV